MRLNRVLQVLVAALVIGGIVGGLTPKETHALEWGDLILEETYESMKKADVKKVLFPHWFHRVRYKCKACHSHIFKMKKGANKIHMGGIIAGDWCGKCHNGSVAFATIECDRCHSYTEEDMGLSALWKNQRAQEAAAARRAAAADADDEDDEDDDDEEESIFLKKVELDPNSPIFMNRAGKVGSTGKPGVKVSKAARLGTFKKAKALRGLRKDKYGLIDWVAAIKDGKIAPVAGVDPVFNKDKFEDYVQIFKAKSDYLEDVAFPHDIHTYLIDCDSCHPSPFISKEGRNPHVKMAKFKQGKWCGKCHGRVAFPLDDCHRCHSREKMAERGK